MRNIFVQLTYWQFFGNFIPAVSYIIISIIGVVNGVILLPVAIMFSILTVLLCWYNLMSDLRFQILIQQHEHLRMWMEEHINDDLEFLDKLGQTIEKNKANSQE